MRIPVVDIVVIGAMKCGTTAAYYFFKENKIFSVNKSKEVNFFLREYDEVTLQGYDRTFLAGEIRIDVSPNYSKRHQYKTNIAQQISRANPNARIIFLARDPLKRIESHLYHNLLRDRIDRRMLTRMDYLENYVLTSSYLFQISTFLEYFEKDNILVLQQEQMRKDPLKFIESLSTFLKIPQLSHLTIDDYYAGDQRYWIAGFDRVKKIMGSKFTFRVYNPFWSFVGVRPKPIFLDDKTKENIRKKLTNDIDGFCTLFSLDKSQWAYFYDLDHDSKFGKEIILK